ncbi:hypothetical protein DRW07_18010 [Alteromonas sediminis]|uniref:Uncharacterized protein n=1 Tax=Alteromonas sediminis TaxID=2259342 RepID=A0A3N5Y446_9ALTE|nr:hypothetical protein [Alteromonas sediminis]RPJ64819.1 hypothetical protein DRW07_18010 [Alteromonas sediminis]
MSGQGSGGNVIAAVCNIFIVGLGQLVQGRFMAAILFFIVTYSLYALAATGAVLIVTWIFWPVAAIFHLWSIINAARYKGSD